MLARLPDQRGCVLPRHPAYRRPASRSPRRPAVATRSGPRSQRSDSSPWLERRVTGSYWINQYSRLATPIQRSRSESPAGMENSSSKITAGFAVTIQPPANHRQRNFTTLFRAQLQAHRARAGAGLPSLLRSFEGFSSSVPQARAWGYMPRLLRSQVGTGKTRPPRNYRCLLIVRSCNAYPLASFGIESMAAL